MTPEKITEILRLHALWLAGDPPGARADLRGADLSGANLRGADLRVADLSGANLRGADLRVADLRDANLSGANLRGADLRVADLRDANLSGADLSGANLSGADLRDANLSGADGLPEIAVPGLAASVLAQIEQHPETWDQSAWHSDCGTRHCVAGWAVTLAGQPAIDAERLLGTAHAARLALGLPLSAECPFGAHDEPLPWLQELAGGAR